MKPAEQIRPGLRKEAGRFACRLRGAVTDGGAGRGESGFFCCLSGRDMISLGRKEPFDIFLKYGIPRPCPHQAAGRKDRPMKKLIPLLLLALLLAAAACAEETLPVLLLSCDGVTETPASADYSWTDASGEGSEPTSVEARGLQPTDPAVPGMLDPVLLEEDRTYDVIWVGDPADELSVSSWNSEVFSDPENTAAYQGNTEIIPAGTKGQITLRPGRIYDFQAKWTDESEGHGVVHYYLVTEKLIMEDGPGSVMPAGWEPVVTEARPLPDDAQAAFDRAMGTLLGAEYTPVALLSTQPGAVTGYCILCQVRYVVPDPVPFWALVYIQAGPEGDARLTNVYELYIERHAEPEE